LSAILSSCLLLGVLLLFSRKSFSFLYLSTWVYPVLAGLLLLKSSVTYFCYPRLKLTDLTLYDYYYSIPPSCDLDQYNGRFQATPEYPNGIYSYIATIDSTGTAQYPFTIGPGYDYGNVASTSHKNTISETTTVYFKY